MIPIVIAYTGVVAYNLYSCIKRNKETNQKIIEKYEENGYDVDENHKYRLLPKVFDIVCSLDPVLRNNEGNYSWKTIDEYAHILTPVFNLSLLYYNIQRSLGNYTKYEQAYNEIIDRCLDEEVIKDLKNQSETFIRENPAKMEWIKDYKDSMEELANKYLDSEKDKKEKKKDKKYKKYDLEDLIEERNRINKEIEKRQEEKLKEKVKKL